MDESGDANGGDEGVEESRVCAEENGEESGGLREGKRGEA